MRYFSIKCTNWEKQQKIYKLDGIFYDEQGSTKQKHVDAMWKKRHNTTLRSDDINGATDVYFFLLKKKKIDLKRELT